jgi:hypothetical protein
MWSRCSNYGAWRRGGPGEFPGLYLSLRALYCQSIPTSTATLKRKVTRPYDSKHLAAVTQPQPRPQPSRDRRHSVHSSCVPTLRLGFVESTWTDAIKVRLICAQAAKQAAQQAALYLVAQHIVQRSSTLDRSTETLLLPRHSKIIRQRKFAGRRSPDVLWMLIKPSSALSTAHPVFSLSSILTLYAYHVRGTVPPHNTSGDYRVYSYSPRRGCGTLRDRSTSRYLSLALRYDIWVPRLPPLARDLPHNIRRSPSSEADRIRTCVHYAIRSHKSY